MSIQHNYFIGYYNELNTIRICTSYTMYWEERYEMFILTVYVRTVCVIRYYETVRCTAQPYNVINV